MKVVDWNDDGVGGITNIDERVFTLLGKYGRYLSSEEYAGFQIHTYTDILLDRPWILFEHLEPPTVRYDGGITLNGVVLGHSEEQETLQQIVDLGGAANVVDGAAVAGCSRPGTRLFDFSAAARC